MKVYLQYYSDLITTASKYIFNRYFMGMCSFLKVPLKVMCVNSLQCAWGEHGWAGQQTNHGSVPSKDKRFLFFQKHLHHPNKFTKSGQEIFFSTISPPAPQTYIRTHRLEVPSSASYLPNLVLRYFNMFELEFMRNQKLE